jgi:ABC-2 type transport system ATP-binding protein
MIKASGLIKNFGHRRAVDGVSFEAEKGAVLGILGPNGAGKTTTIRMVAGFLTPDDGTVWVNGIDVAEDPVEAQKHIGYMPETTPLYGDMTVCGFLRFLAEVRGFSGAERDRRVDGVLDRCFLQPVRNQTVDTLSKGYRQRTCFAQTLLHDPDILLLDEPTEGLDPNQKQVVRTMIREMAKDKVIMLSTHVLEEVEAICTRAIIISSGKIVADDRPSALKARSSRYNAVTMDVEGKGVKEALEKIPDIGKIQTLESSGSRERLLLLPKSGKSIAAGVLETVHAKGWKLHDMKVDEGRLDDVFRRITTTEDTREAE